MPVQKARQSLHSLGPLHLKGTHSLSSWVRIWVSSGKGGVAGVCLVPSVYLLLTILGAAIPGGKSVIPLRFSCMIVWRGNPWPRPHWHIYGASTVWGRMKTHSSWLRWYSESKLRQFLFPAAELDETNMCICFFISALWYIVSLGASGVPKPGRLKS